MGLTREDLSSLLSKRFETRATVLESFGETTLMTDSDNYFSVIEELKEGLGFDLLVDLTAVEEDFLRMVVHLYNLRDKVRIRVTSRVRGDLSMPSLVPLWKGALWLEREVYDLFGIRFEGHPNLKRILLWEGFPGHPLRKDYPLRKRPPMPEPK